MPDVRDAEDLPSGRRITYTSRARCREGIAMAAISLGESMNLNSVVVRLY